MGQEFQIKNQNLINIIVNGFCQRLQVREVDLIDEFKTLFEPIELSQPLQLRFLKIMSIRELSKFFEHFRCEKESIALIEREGRLVLSRIL